MVFPQLVMQIIFKHLHMTGLVYCIVKHTGEMGYSVIF